MSAWSWSTEMRGEQRELANGVAILRWADASGKLRISEVVVRNISPGGAQLESSESIPPHQTVRLSGESWECVGQVRYCRSWPDFFVVGLQFTERPFFKAAVPGK